MSDDASRMRRKQEFVIVLILFTGVPVLTNANACHASLGMGSGSAWSQAGACILVGRGFHSHGTF